MHAVGSGAGIAVQFARLLIVDVPGDRSSAYGPARITGGGLNPDIFEWPFAQQSAISDAIERHTAGQADVLLTRFSMDRVGEPKHDLFRYDLN